MPFSSTRTGMPPREVTQSTMMSAHPPRGLPLPPLWSGCTCRWKFRLAPSRPLRPLTLDEVARFLGVERHAPGLLQPDHGGALPASHFAHAVGEEASAQQRELAARLGEIRDCGFHAGTSSSGNREIERVVGGEGVPQQQVRTSSTVWKKNGSRCPTTGCVMAW